MKYVVALGITVVGAAVGGFVGAATEVGLDVTLCTVVGGDTLVACVDADDEDDAEVAPEPGTGHVERQVVA